MSPGLLPHPKRYLRLLSSKLCPRIYSYRNYLRFVRSGQVAMTGGIPDDKDEVERELKRYHINLQDYHIDAKAFFEYLNAAEYPEKYITGNRENFTEKALEHFLSFQFADIGKESVVVDVANSGSPFPAIIHAMKNCRVISNDLIFPNGSNVLTSWHTQIGGNACDLPLPDNSVDLIVLHCAFEMFEGENDKNFVRKAYQLLRESGTLVIVPLYLHNKHHILVDPKSPRRKLPGIDPGAERVYRQDFYGVGFSRIYSPRALFERLIEKNRKYFEITIYKVVNAQQINERCYLYWIGVFKKQINGPQATGL